MDEEIRRLRTEAQRLARGKPVIFQEHSPTEP
jgi:hypothetical protein